MIDKTDFKSILEDDIMSELFDFPKVEFLGGAKGVNFLDAKGYNFYNPEEV